VRVSVAMCTYNGGCYVREQLDSIAAQTRPPDELVVCDDNSSDATGQLLREFAARAPMPVRLHFSRETLGSTNNFAKAISLCEGEVIALSDQDDYWLPEKLARAEAALAAAPDAGMVFSDAEVVDEDLRPLGYGLWEYLRFGREEQRAVTSGDAFNLLLARNIVVGATMAFRSSFKELILPIPGEFNLSRGDGRILIHDGWASLLISAVAGVAVVAEPLMKYRQHPGQQVGAKAGAAQDGGGLRAAVSRPNFYDAEIGQLAALRERLAAKVPAAAARALSKLDAKIAHLRARAGMPEQRSRRLLRVLREVLSLRYHQYSNGVRSAAKDLLRR
jgi:glycosyltransferase involved in cell wall biosynthesis